ncbi:unnamed protein product [Calypogeia fissa]
MTERVTDSLTDSSAPSAIQPASPLGWDLGTSSRHSTHFHNLVTLVYTTPSTHVTIATKGTNANNATTLLSTLRSSSADLQSFARWKSELGWSRNWAGPEIGRGAGWGEDWKSSGCRLVAVRCSKLQAGTACEEADAPGGKGRGGRTWS